jgi:hypothetical protein
MKDLNLDHVVPRALGGKTTWDNIVTSCFRCNLSKGCKTLEQSGLKLLKRPTKPKTLPISGIFMLPRHVPDLWMPYLGAAAAFAEAG